MSATGTAVQCNMFHPAAPHHRDFVCRFLFNDYFGLLPDRMLMLDGRSARETI